MAATHLRRLARGVLARMGIAPETERPARGLKAVNIAFVDLLKGVMPHEEAMEIAIGGNFAEIGAVELALVQHYGLPQDGRLVDVGCGSGRLAQPLSAWMTGSYLGLDLVPDLIAHAARISARADWRFEVVDHIGIPDIDSHANMVCFFSVLTHLQHEQSYWYLEEARRVLKPGGRIVFSFLELCEPVHLQIFRDTVGLAKQGATAPMNTFIDRGTIGVWAAELGMGIVDLRGGGDVITAQGALGQSVCVLEKAA
ncbi:MAG: methyltransferase type 11 [Alphaproteobacteria bacterium PA2]|nr:MAG: methyltransferase type 11 [Alphaproteobacteria bacterium PA2]